MTLWCATGNHSWRLWHIEQISWLYVGNGHGHQLMILLYHRSPTISQWYLFNRLMKSRSRQFGWCSIEVMHSINWLYSDRSRSIGVIRSVGRLSPSRSHGDQSRGRWVYPNSCPPLSSPRWTDMYIVMWFITLDEGSYFCHIESWFWCHFLQDMGDQLPYHFGGYDHL